MNQSDRGTCVGQSYAYPCGYGCFKPYERLMMLLEGIAMVEGLVLFVIILSIIQSVMTGKPIVW